MGVDLGSAFGAASRDAAEQASRAQSKALGLTEEEIASLYQGLLEDPMNFSPSTDTYSKQFRQRYPKYNPTALLQDPVQMLPKLDSLIDKDTAEELSATYVDMLKEAGIEAAEENNIQDLMGDGPEHNLIRVCWPITTKTLHQ